ncbi:MAG: BatA domain-containing protein [Verrucomicrobiota bacterium]
MGFLSPLMLGALAVVAVPIAIHLINKFRVRQTKWAAMRFLQEGVKSSRRKVLLQDLILLILRCLAVLLLVLAFTRPVLREEIKATDYVDAGPLTAVVLLDNSASMGQSDGVKTRLAMGRESIEESIGKLEGGSKMAFYLVSDRPNAMVAQPTPDLARVRRSLEMAETTDRSTDLLRAVSTAYQVLRTSPDDRREIHLYTDSQLPAWDGFDAILRLRQENPGIALKTLVQGARGEDNLAIVNLEQEGGVPAAGQPTRFRVDVANFGEQPVSNIRVTLAANGDPPSGEALIERIGPGSTQGVTLFVRLDEPGFHTIEAAIPPDRLPVDNQRTTAVQVVDQLKVLLVEGKGTGPVIDRDGYYLANALVPVSSDRASQYFLDLAAIPFGQLSGFNLEDYGVVFLANPSAPTPALADQLKGYVEGGGGLVLFPGENTDLAAWRTSPMAQWLPAIWTQDVKERAQLQGQDYVHPITSVWGTEDGGSLGKVELNRHYQLLPRQVPPEETEGEGEAAPRFSKPQVVLELANGEPAVVEGQVGAGHVAVFNTTATPDWTNLPLHPGFVPLMQRTLGYLEGGRRAQLVLSPGAAFEMEVPMDLLGRDFTITRPGSDERRPAGRVDLEDGRAVVRYRDTAQAGAYHIYFDQDTRPTAAFAVQIDPAESDLRQLPGADIERLKEAAPLAEAAERPGFTAPQMKVSYEFWLPLIWAAALVVLAEMILAHYMSRPQT